MTAPSQINVLTGLTVAEAMRRQVVSLPHTADLSQAIRSTIKFKVNAVLITGEAGQALGVVSKTDLMGAYYGELPLGMECAAVMVGPPSFCGPRDTLEAALESMRSQRIHRLYVHGETPGEVAGVLAYPDIVGLLYRFCHRCDKSLAAARQRKLGLEWADLLLVKEVMTPEVVGVGQDQSLAAVMETLAGHRLGAVLITDAAGLPAGVVSKTDLMLAYIHGLSPQVPARQIMNAPPLAVSQDDPLLDALHLMILSDVHRIFVYRQDWRDMAGVLSLSDAARYRSGSCRACLSSRIKV